MNNLHMRDGRVEFRWKRWRNKKRQEVSFCLMVLFSGMVLFGAGGIAAAGPTGGQITSGTGNISQAGPNTNINQTSHVLDINWQNFSTTVGESVNFNQPDSSAIAINRVVGGVPSVLAGALNANGRVFVLNSAGITFTGTSHVNVGALLATTAMTVNGDPTQSASFSGTGYGAVINQGSIEISNGGFAILAAPYVQNTGFIKADLGTIALAGTNSFTLDLSGTGLINFVVPPGTVEEIESDGQAVGVDNSGTLQARSGQVIISANVATQVVNAVVNLNGIVDADAFAPNGKGGSVLVTTPGDINVGGQVTARGAGTGAGGQIVTKAGGDDAIETMAFVSAAGGASGGKGGFIEVSGRQLGLAGVIDPGSGGSLLIDPANMLVTPFSGANNFNSAIVNEHFVEQQLQANHNVNLQANHNITFAGGSGGTFTLHGGGGNLTVNAGTGASDDIAFLAQNYIIRTGAGQVGLTAGGDIGSGTNRLSVVSGTGLPGVTHAGDIKLTTLHGDIFVNTITSRAAGANGDFTAKFTASAGDTFNAIGLIDVEARASGALAHTADAEIHINAQNNIEIQAVTELATAIVANGFFGSGAATALFSANAVHNFGANGLIDVEARANGFSGQTADAEIHINAGSEIQLHGITDRANAFENSGGVDVFANAIVTLNGTHVADSGNIALLAQVGGSSGFSFIANADLTISNASDVEVTAGKISVSAKVNATHVSTAVASAKAHFDSDGHISIGSLDVEASGAGGIVGNLIEVAAAELHGTSIEIDGNAIANADGAARQGGYVLAQASIDASGSHIDIAGNAFVQASANNVNRGRSASASANLFLTAHSGESESSGEVAVHGNVTVNALARDGGQNNDADAFACLDIQATDSIAIDGDVAVTANDQVLHLHTGDLSTPHASACAILGAGSGGIHLGGNLSVKAQVNSANSDSVIARARAQLTAFFGSIEIDGSTKVTADANDNARLVNATGPHAGASASASLLVHAEGHVSLGAVTVTANATDNGIFEARAVAKADILAHSASSRSVSIFGPVDVEASAKDPAGSSAFASANLTVEGRSVTIGFAGSDGSAPILGDVTIRADAVDGGGGNASAQANLKITATSGDVAVIGNIDVNALASVAFGGNAVANAIADIVAGSDGGGSVQIGGFSFADDAVVLGGDINVTGNAVDGGGGAALALAELNFDPGTVRVLGDMVVSAAANAHGVTPGGTAASANAQIVFSSVAVVEVDGNMSIFADATNHGQGKVIGQGGVDFGTADSIFLDAVTIGVKALNLGSGSGGANAVAAFNMSTGTVSQFAINSLNLQAQASSHGTGDAVANATGKLTHSNLSISSNVIVNAVAVALGGGSANALADLELNAPGGFLDVSGNVDVRASANAHAGGNALANAVADILADGTSGFSGDIHIGFNSGETFANGDVSVIANAQASGEGGSAVALANLKVDAVLGAVDIIGNVDVEASANALGGGKALASGFANIVAGEGSIHVGGSESGFLFAGNVAVTANALAQSGGDASGLANLQMLANDGDLTIYGNLTVAGTANATGGGPALAEAIGNLVAHSGSGEGATPTDIQIGASTAFSGTYGGNVSVTANAYDGGGGPANALAELTLDPGSIHVYGNIDVTALANAHGIPAPGSAAVANAQLVFSSVSTVDVGGNVSVLASAVNVGHGKVNGQAAIVFDSIGGGIDLGQLSITANALNNASGTGGAIANASFNATAGAHVSLDALVLKAQASSIGSGNATAHAVGKIDPDGISIGGNVIVDATAVTGGAGNASALADLEMTAASGAITVGGSVDVQANAQARLSGKALANAFASIAATGVDGSGDIRIGSSTISSARAGNVEVAADASAGSKAATAFADLQMVAHNGDVTILGNLDVTASGISRGAGGALAEAMGNIVAISGSVDESSPTAIQIGASTLFGFHGGNVDVAAVASDQGGGAGNAHAQLTLDPGSVHVFGDLIVSANVSAHGVPTGQTAASANAQLIFGGAGAITVGGDMSILANAINHGHGKVQANGGVTFGSASNIDLADVTIAVKALNLGTGSTAGSGGAHASAVFNQTNLSVSLQLDSLNLLAQATSHGGGNAFANAFGHIAQQELAISGNVTVNAVAVSDGGDPGNATALADLALTANSGDLTVSGNIDVHALANDVGGNAKASALANLVAKGTGASHGHIHVGTSTGFGGHSNGAVFVRAYANDSGGPDSSHVAASANGHLSFNALSVKVEGSMSIVGHATNHGNGQVKAKGAVDFASATSIDLAAVTIDVKALNLTSGSGGAKASASFNQTNAGVHVQLDSLNLQAEASSNGGGGATANAIGRIAQGSLSIPGDVTVNAVAFDNGGGSIVFALADLELAASTGDLFVGGDVTVTAKATATDPLAVIAGAVVDLEAAGSIAVAGDIDVAAVASTHASEGTTFFVYANALLNMHASGGIALGSSSLTSGQRHFFGGDVTVTANEFADRSVIGLAIARANLAASSTGDGDAFVDLFIAGNLQVQADAGGGIEEGDVVALASLAAFATGDIFVHGGIGVVANANDPGTGAAAAKAVANLNASSGSVEVDGDINVKATLQGNAIHFGEIPNEIFGLIEIASPSINAGFASAALHIQAESGVSLNGVTVRANTLLTNLQDAESLLGDEGSPSAGARASLAIDAGSGDVLIAGPVNVGAKAKVSANHVVVLASALGSIAGDDVSIANPLSFIATANALGTEDAIANAISDIEVIASGDITLPVATSRAKAAAPESDHGGAQAVATLLLSASGDLNITHSGAFAGASANAPFGDDGSVFGSANIQLIAGHTVNINGSVVAAAVGLGGGTDNVADAIVNIEAGGAGFGSVNMFGDILALAFADPRNDHALASVTINAHNDIFVIGDDPIASAHAGDAFAFLQTHFTDHTTGNGGTGSSAKARITIRAGGTVTFTPLDKNQRLALQALPTHTPPLSSGGLTTIQLQIDGQDCGVLGSAGAGGDNAKSCTKSPMNGDVPDALP